MLPGLAGIFLPFPGLLYMLAISIVFGFMDKFEHIQYWEIGVLLAITLVGIIVSYLSGILGAKYGGAAQKSLFLGIIGMIIGTVLLPPFGGLIGVFIGILASEILLRNDQRKALRAATGGLVGSIAGMFMDLVLSVTFLFIFVIFAIK